MPASDAPPVTSPVVTNCTPSGQCGRCQRPGTCCRDERTTADQLIGQLGYAGYLLADGNYDASHVYEAAAARGYQLVAPPRKATGKRRRKQSPHRRRSIELLTAPALPAGEFGRDLYRQHTAIERCFGQATSFGGGLSPLPAWVLGLPRVRTWVWAKLIINAVRIRRSRT
jgi:hypothetical protein